MHTAEVFTASTFKDCCRYGCIKKRTVYFIEKLHLDVILVHVNLLVFLPCELYRLRFGNTFLTRNCTSWGCPSETPELAIFNEVPFSPMASPFTFALSRRSGYT